MTDDLRDRLRLGAAVIGCGHWGTNYLRVLDGLPSVRLVAACDERSDRLRELRYLHPSLTTTPDVGAVLENPDVDVVVVCTPATTHRDFAMRALSAGKHVLVEKPLARTAPGCDDLIQTADAKGLTLMVGHTFLYNPAVLKLREFVTAEESGPVYYLYSRRTNLGPIRADVSAVWDLAPHDVSIFNFVLGSEPEWVSAVGARPLGTSREDVGFLVLGYPNQVLGHIHVSWADPSKTREVVVVAEERRVVFNDLDLIEPVRVYEKGVTRRRPAEFDRFAEPAFSFRDGWIVSPPVDGAEPLKRQCEHFLHCVETGARPFSDGHAGMAVVRVIEALDRSIQRGGVRESVLAASPWLGSVDGAGPGR